MASVSYCGIDCTACDWREKMNCKTCKPYRGDIWHGTCRVAKCCIERGVEDCGLCDSLPCALLLEFAFDAEHGDGGRRIANLCSINGLAEPTCNRCCGENCVNPK